MPPTSVDSIVQSAFDFGRVMRRKMMCSGKGDLPVVQLHLLALASEHAGVTMSQVADYLQISSPSATSIVDRLVKSGHIARMRDLMNRKLVRLTITKKGAATLRKKMAEKKVIIAGILSVLTEEDRKTLDRILKELVAHVSHASSHPQ